MAKNDVQILLSAQDRSSPAFRAVQQAAARTQSEIEALGRSTSTLNQVFTSAAGFAAGMAGFNGLTYAIQGTVGAIFNFQKSMEVHETGMAGILLSMTQLDGRTLTWGESLSLSKNIMSQLNGEALRTAASTEELTNAFRGILGPALNAKMTIDEIIQLSTVGANAVKSIMPGNANAQMQIVQELRDLVAGGIQPASSTLATALGLKDADIKAAKESSEGLFNFLMERLKGFEQSAPAYSKTWQGITDQIKEGFTLAGSKGFDGLFAAAKTEMAGLAEQVIVFNEATRQMEVNPEIVSSFKEIGDTAAVAFQEVKAIGSDITTVAAPAVSVLGSALKYAAENAQALTYAIGGWVAFSKLAATFNEIRAVTAGATTAQTLLGSAVLSGTARYREQAAASAATAIQERAEVINTASVIRAAEAEKLAIQRNASAATKGILAAEEAGYYALANTIRGLSAEYTALGFTAKEAGLMQLQAAQMAQKGNFLLAEQLIATREAHIANAAAATQASAAAVTGSTAAAGAVRGLLSAVWALAGGWMGVAAAIGYAIYQLHQYKQEKAYLASSGVSDKDNLESVQGYDSGAEVFRDKTTQRIYKNVDVSYGSEGLDRYHGGPKRELQELSEDEYTAFYKNEWKSQPPKFDPSGLEPKFDMSALGAGGGGSGGSGSARAAERAYEQQQKLIDKIADMNAKMNKKINEENATAYEASMSKITEETDNMRRELDKSKIDFQKYGMDVSGVYANIAKYQDMMSAKIEKDRRREIEDLGFETDLLNAAGMADQSYIVEIEYQQEMAKINRDFEDKEYYNKIAKGSFDIEAGVLAIQHRKALEAEANRELIAGRLDALIAVSALEREHSDNLVALGMTTAERRDELNRRTLDKEIANLREGLSAAETNSEEYYTIYDELARAIEERNQIMSRNIAGGATVAAQSIMAGQYNFADMYKNTWNDIDSSVKGHFKSMLDGSQSMSEGIKGTILDLSNSIVSMFAEVAYQSLIMQPIKNWFTGLLGGIGGGDSGSTWDSLGGGNYGSVLPGFASGGVAHGWSIVGEQGPELVNFSNPTRVYDTQKTKEALSGKQKQSQAPINISFNFPNGDADSFKRSQTQVMADLGVALSRAQRRNR